MSKSYDINNPFAKILRGELPCKKVYEDDHNLAFHSIDPKCKIHVLVIPKGQYINYEDFIMRANVDEIISFNHAIVETRKLLNLEDGYRIIANNGKNSGQTVFHLHFHIIGGQKLSE